MTLVLARTMMSPPSWARSPLVVWGGCLELGSEGAPYAPFVAVLRGLVRRFGLAPVAALLPPAGTALGDWLPDLGPAPAR